MASLSQSSRDIVDAMESALAPANATTTAFQDTVFHANFQIESVEKVPRRAPDLPEETRLLSVGATHPDDVAHGKRAAEMQMWWDEAITRNMDLPDGYAKVAVLLVKWADELDELNTRAEAEELDAIFRERFHFSTETVELNVATKPHHQMLRHMSAFVEKHDGPRNLLIVYYTGHGVYREDLKCLQLSASRTPTVKRGLNQEALCNWNKVEDVLRSDDVESDVLTILDTCYSSNLVKSGKEETRTFELLSACPINVTTAAPGDLSFTRALIDALQRLRDQYGEKGFTTFHLNQAILLDKRREDTPSQLWFRLQHHGRHILLAPLKLQQDRKEKARKLPPLPRGYLTLRFALRDESLTQEQIEFLTQQLSKAFNNKLLVGLSRIDWLGIKPARTTHFGRAAHALSAIAQWKRVVEKRRQLNLSHRTLDQVKRLADSTMSESPTPTPRKRSRDEVNDLCEPERKREYPTVSPPPSPPVSDSSEVAGDLTGGFGR